MNQKIDSIIETYHYKGELIHYNAKEATTKSAGNIEHWQCKECKRFFADANASTELTQSDIVIPQLKPSNTELEDLSTVKILKQKVAKKPEIKPIALEIVKKFASID